MLAISNSLFSSSDDSDGEPEPRRKKRFRPRINFDIVHGRDFLEKFRIGKEQFEFVLNKIGSYIQHNTKKNLALSSSQQLLVALHWLGNGAQYHGIADMHGVSKATVARVIKRVVQELNRVLMKEIIKWPDNATAVALDFLRKGGFPLVCGCVDGTLVKIDAPTQNEAAFVDRHGDHSINCMMVCGPDYSFYFVSSRWPGSVHDARVLRNSSLCQKFDSGWRPFPDAVMLGDTAYGLKDWLIPPAFNNPNDATEQRFNVCHKSTRSFKERSYGILKERFPCLNYLRVNPKLAGNIIMACAILHNIANKEDFVGLPPSDSSDDDNGMDVSVDISGQERLSELLSYFA